MVFENRYDAGTNLALLLNRYNKDPHSMVLAMPRGGLPVAYEIAKKLSLPLDLLLVKKLGVPDNEELALGAVSLGDVVYINEELLSYYSISKQELNKRIEKGKREIQERNRKYRLDAPPPVVLNKHIILVDDGIATGASIKAGIRCLKMMKAKSITIAVPVASMDTLKEIKSMWDDIAIICLETPGLFMGVGQVYIDFHQLSDEEVLMLLEEAKDFDK